MRKYYALGAMKIAYVVAIIVAMGKGSAIGLLILLVIIPAIIYLIYKRTGVKE